MRVKLKTLGIIAFIIFVLVIVLRVTNGLQYVLMFFELAGIYIVLATLLLIIVIMLYTFVFNKKVERESDIEAKAWAFLQDWWSNKMGMAEPLKLQDGFMKRGYYDSGAGMTEMFVGFNVTKMGSNTRIIFIVGTKPMSIAHWDNSPGIGEHQDPFLNYYPIPPKPVPHFSDDAVQARLSGHTIGYGYGNYRKRKYDKDAEDKKDEGEFIDGNR